MIAKQKGLICAVILSSLSTALFAQGLDETGVRLAPPSPSLNFYGVSGLIDTPSGEASPDGQIGVSVSYFGGQTRTTFAFQAFERVNLAFRYTGIQDWEPGFDNRDRSFDFRYLLLKEGEYRPAVTIGLQDFAGTGLFSSEYIVATKNFERPFRLPGRVKLSAGLGWGRLGTNGDIGSPFGTDRTGQASLGGELSVDEWFRGPAAPFGGIEWQVNDRLGLKAEYSSDAYVNESNRGLIDQKSRFNFGVEYQVNPSLRLGGYWLYGSEIGVSAQLQFNAKSSVRPYTVSGPRPIIVRPNRSANPQAYSTAWAGSTEASLLLRDAVSPELAENGLVLESLHVGAERAELRVSSRQIDTMALVVGRSARVLARILPPSVEIFEIVLVENGLALSKVSLPRTDLERLEFEPNASARILAAAEIGDAAPRPSVGSVISEASLPRYSWSLGPYIRASYFDPESPVRADAGIELSGRYRFAPGWSISGSIRHRLTGNISDSDRVSDSVLTPVRTNSVRYAREGQTGIERLYISKQWKPGVNTYARVSAGYLEQMFGGVSAELLWKPAASRLGVGAEINYVKQRDFDQLFGFQDYDVATGHVSAYYDLGRGYLAQVDMGRYLAGDVGATFTLEREFSNGFRVGGFFTMTDVSSEEFGEGSFDKGIKVSIPLSWFTGAPSRQRLGTTIRPIQRDGGARLDAPDRLYEQVRDGHQVSLTQDWGRIWD